MRKGKCRNYSIGEREKFILDNYDKYTSEELANKFEVSTRTIQSFCKRNKIVCKREKTKTTNIETYIYLVEFTKDIIYIGYTSNMITRMRMHVSYAKNKKHSSAWIVKQVEDGNLDYILQCFKNVKILHYEYNSNLKDGLRKESEYIVKYKLEGKIILGGEHDWIDVKLFNDRNKSAF